MINQAKYNFPTAHPVNPKMEVVGNIFENPELLEKESEKK